MNNNLYFLVKPNISFCIPYNEANSLRLIALAEAIVRDDGLVLKDRNRKTYNDVDLELLQEIKQMNPPFVPTKNVAFEIIDSACILHHYNYEVTNA